MNTSKKAALLTAGFLLLLTAASLLAILSPESRSAGYIADIYQDGVLTESIPLNRVTEPYTLTLTGKNGGLNQLEIRSGSIGMLSANCPDKLCVHQGFISDTRLPITCLPNRVVIVLRPADSSESPDKITPDVTTY